MRMKKNDKGFTLVELIVVITILAILAAIMVPSCMKYIDKAREKEVLMKARSAMIVAQAEFSDAYGRGIALAGTTATVSASTNASVYAIFNEILSVAEFKEKTNLNDGKGTVLDKSIISMQIGTPQAYEDGMTNEQARKAYTITYFALTSTKGTVYYVNGAWETELSAIPSSVKEVYTITNINSTDAVGVAPSAP